MSIITPALLEQSAPRVTGGSTDIVISAQPFCEDGWPVAHIIKRWHAITILAILVLQGAVEAYSAEAEIRLRIEGTNTFLQVEGDPDDDWHIQASGDLVTWSNLTALGPLLSGDAYAPFKSISEHLASRCFYRALRTDGLYDVTLLRTISMTFTQPNWPTLLASARTAGTNVPVFLLTLDNGATLAGAGARYKGNTSYTMAGQKKSLNIELDYIDTAADLMGYETVNLNNAAGDETIMREPLYFNVMRNYAPCPRSSFVKLNINGAYWGIYSFVQQENADLIDEWFPSSAGDRWRAPNIGGGGGGGGGFNSGRSALTYLGTNEASYRSTYELKTQHSTNPWVYLIHAADVLNNTPADQLRDKVEEVLAVDRWLWFLAVENVFADDDSYFNKGADYVFYYEPESGRIHPIEHDGNEAFVAGDVSLSPVQGATSTNRPVLYRLLRIPELRQRYLAHLRTVLEESFNPTALTPLINHYSALTVTAITADTRKSYTMTAYTNDLNALKSFIANRHAFLTNHAELRPAPPDIVAVNAPTPTPTAGQAPFITARVLANGTNGLGSVWLYHRDKPYGRFTTEQMLDDGAHSDGAANDGIFGAATTNYPAGHKIHYYVEARSANSARTASFSPARAEQETFSYRVIAPTATNSPVVINELMASNSSAVPDPQGEYDDWIELRNITDQPVDLTGRYLSDEPNNPRKWQFPAGTIIQPNGFLIVWADEDGAATTGLHASFRLSASGESLFLTDTDQNFNAVLDSVTYGLQETDRSYGRPSADPRQFEIMQPTPDRGNF